MYDIGSVVAEPGLGRYEEDISPLCKPLLRIIDQNKPVTELFYELTNRLDKFFSLSKAALVTNSPADDSLKMMAFWENSVIRHGIMLTLPRKRSLFYKSFDKKDLVYIPIFDKYSGNFIERKILFDETAGTVIICPLISNNICCGLISLTSPVPYAFDMLQEGHFNILFNKFADLMSSKQVEIVLSTTVPAIKNQ